MILKNVLHALMQTIPYIMDLLLFSVAMNLGISILGVIFIYNCQQRQEDRHRGLEKTMSMARLNKLSNRFHFCGSNSLLPLI